MLRTILCFMILSVLTFPQSQPPTDVERLKAGAMKGSVDDANALSKLKEKPAIEAMRDVLKKSDKVPVKIAMIQGLGHNNKDLESVPLFLDIMEQNDQMFDLHAKANEAVEICGVPGRFYKPKEDLKSRREKVQDMRDDHKMMMELKLVPAVGHRSIPNAVIYVRESIFPDTYMLKIPFAENGLRMRVSTSNRKSETSFHLELEVVPASKKMNWDWKDLIIRVDVEDDGSIVVSAAAAITSPYSFDLYDSNGKLLIYDFSPGTRSDYKFPK